MKAKLVRFVVAYLVGMVVVWYGFAIWSSVQQAQPKPYLVSSDRMICSSVGPVTQDT